MATSILSHGIALKQCMVQYATQAYYAAFVFYFASTWIFRVNVDSILWVPSQYWQLLVRILAFTCLAWKFVSIPLNWKGYMLSLVVVALGFITWRVSDEGWLFWLMLFIITAKGVDLRHMANIALICSAALIIAVPMLCGIGVIPEKIIVTHEVVRHTLGFMHPNYFGGLILIICIAVSVLRFGKNPWIDSVLIIVLLTINLWVAHSRSSAILGVIQIILLWIFYLVHTERWRRVLSWIMFAAVIIAIGLSYFTMALYSPNNVVFKAINTVLSDRARLAHGYFSMQPLTLFGSTFEGHKIIAWEADGSPSNFLVDNVYAHLLLRYGVIATVVLLSALLAVLVILIRHNSWNSTFFGLILFLLYGLTEAAGIRIDANFLLPYIGICLMYSSGYFLRSDRSNKILRGE